MRHRPLKLLIPGILLPVLLLSACLGKTPAGTQGGASSAPPTASAPAGPSLSPSSSAAPSVSAPPSPGPTNWHSGVKTDYSGLTPYEPLKEKYTRLSDGALPDLKPSADYGKLMTYTGASLYGKTGYVAFNLFGLVTARGMIVTDPVYSRAYQGSAYDYVSFKSVDVPAFDLQKITDTIDKKDPWNNIRHAVCALDGSWITKFDYSSVFFTDRVIIAVRNFARNDIDVLSYYGKLLYNTTFLGCYDVIPPQSAYVFESGYGEGLFAVPLTTGQTAYIDVLTGAIRYTPYGVGEAFNGGYARVRQKENGPIGFINRDFKLIVKPQYVFADLIGGSKAIVQLQDNSYAVVDMSGNTLFKSASAISRWDANTYGVHQSNGITRFYDGNFKEIASGNSLAPLANGWFYYRTATGVVVQKGSETHTLTGIKDIGDVEGGFVCYYVNGADKWSSGVKTLDGRDVVPLTENVNVSLVKSRSNDLYIILTSFNRDGAQQSYKVLDKDGKTLLSGRGWATFDEKNNLFMVNDEQSFGYADLSGQYTFRVSLLRDVPD